jgi:hypothetical protein
MADAKWEDARRLEAWAGEVRVNLIRAVALVLFYGNHLLNLYLYKDDPTLQGEAGARLHANITTVVLAWAIGVVALHVFLTRRWMPPALMYVSTAWDLLLTTALIAMGADGPRSPLMLLYFVIVAAAPLRLSLPLVYTTTLGAMAAALIALGQYVFIRVPAELQKSYFDLPPGDAHRVPRVSELIFLLALGAVGLLAGQVVRQARRLVQGYPVRVAEEKEAA